MLEIQYTSIIVQFANQTSAKIVKCIIIQFKKIITFCVSEKIQLEAGLNIIFRNFRVINMTFSKVELYFFIYLFNRSVIILFNIVNLLYDTYTKYLIISFFGNSKEW